MRAEGRSSAVKDHTTRLWTVRSSEQNKIYPRARLDCVRPRAPHRVGGIWTRRTAEAWARAAVPWELSVERGVSNIARGKNAPWVLHMSGWSENKNHTLGLLISRGNVSAGTILRRIFSC